MAFYDSVAVIAGRSIVTIDPLPTEQKPIVQQPTRRLRWDTLSKRKNFISKSVPIINETQEPDEQTEKQVVTGVKRLVK